MDRIRIIWSRLWKIIKDHYSNVGIHPNLQIAMYAVDSLKQLSSKFLQKRELSHFQYQKDFLEPFELIFLKTSSKFSIKKKMFCFCDYSKYSELKLILLGINVKNIKYRRKLCDQRIDSQLYANAYTNYV